MKLILVVRLVFFGPPCHLTHLYRWSIMHCYYLRCLRGITNLTPIMLLWCSHIRITDLHQTICAKRAIDRGMPKCASTPTPLLVTGPTLCSCTPTHNHKKICQIKPHLIPLYDKVTVPSTTEQVGRGGARSAVVLEQAIVTKVEQTVYYTTKLSRLQHDNNACYVHQSLPEHTVSGHWEFLCLNMSSHHLPGTGI